MDNYIKKLRSKVGHDELILNYAGCIIFDENNRLLLQRRKDCGKWGFLGGLVELGESVEEAAIREIKEESGLDVEIISFFGVYSKYFEEYSNGDKVQTIVHVFKAKVVSGDLVAENEETLELKYFELDNVPPLFNQQHQDTFDDIMGNLYQRRFEINFCTCDANRLFFWQIRCCRELILPQQHSRFEEPN